jgi:hypothetical protein
VLTENARHSAAKTKWRFDVEAGQEIIGLPPGLDPEKISRVCLLGLRNRPINVQFASLAEVKEFGRKFVFNTMTGVSEVPIKGFPLYYTIIKKNMAFWPVPAHNWSGIIEGEESDGTQDC